MFVKSYLMQIKFDSPFAVNPMRFGRLSSNLRAHWYLVFREIPAYSHIILTFASGGSPLLFKIWRPRINMETFGAQFDGHGISSSVV